MSSKSSHSNHDKAVDVKVKICYFMSILQESVEKKIDCSRSQLTRFTKYNKLKSHELIKYFPNNRVECEYRNPLTLLQRQCSNTHFVLSSYMK